MCSSHIELSSHPSLHVQYFILLKGVVPKDLIDTALAFATVSDEGEETKYCAIHSQEQGEVGRLVLGSSPEHLAEMTAQDGGEAYVGDDPVAATIYLAYKNLCQDMARAFDLTERPIDTVEIVKNEPHSKGQDDHMDNLEGVWNMLSPLVNHCPATLVKEQDYQDYPDHMGPSSHVPRGWDGLPDIHLEWEVGDMLMLRSNAIHAGPPTGADRRSILFASEMTLRVADFTDTKVYTEKEFFDAKDFFDALR